MIWIGLQGWPRRGGVVLYIQTRDKVIYILLDWNVRTI